jgi:hypothetical protein
LGIPNAELYFVAISRSISIVMSATVITPDFFTSSGGGAFASVSGTAGASLFFLRPFGAASTASMLFTSFSSSREELATSSRSSP